MKLIIEVESSSAASILTFIALFKKKKKRRNIPTINAEWKRPSHDFPQSDIRCQEGEKPISSRPEGNHVGPLNTVENE